MFPWVKSFADADGFEIGFPKVLEELFVLGYQVVLQNAGNEMGLSFIIEGDLLYGFQIIIKAIFSLDVVDEPRLVGKAKIWLLL